MNNDRVTIAGKSSPPKQRNPARLASLRRSLLAHAEPLAAVSIAHLRPDTREWLANDTLSVIAYPNEYGGFVYVGSAGENHPTEPELVPIFEIAGAAGIVWIKFDAEAAAVDGLPVFDAPPWM